MSGPSIHRPRNLDWQRAAALLYGDWGTSKAYVIGLAFLVAGYSRAANHYCGVCAHRTGVLQLHCHLPTFSRWRWRFIRRHDIRDVARCIGSAVAGRRFDRDGCAERLVSNELFWGPKSVRGWATVGAILAVYGINYFGPKHSGSFAMSLALQWCWWWWRSSP